MNRKDIFTKNKDILYIIPPFPLLDMPNIGIHLLRMISDRMSIKSDIYYANLDFAMQIGENTYKAITHKYNSLYEQNGERVFTHIAYPEKDILGNKHYNLLISEKVLLSDLSSIAEKWINDAVNDIIRASPKTAHFYKVNKLDTKESGISSIIFELE